MIRSRGLNVLLIMPRLVQNIGDGYVFPLGMAYISASLKQAKVNVFTLNLNHRPGDVPTVIEEYIKKHAITLVGTGGLSPQYHLIKHILKAVKDYDSAILTVVGGGIISSEPEIAMQALEYADFGVIGEGELTICELVHGLEHDAELTTIDGLIIKQGERLVRTNARADIQELDSLPWADYAGFDIEHYLELPPPAFGGLNHKRMIPMLASRSCPYKCTFCFHSLGTKYRKRSLDHFFGELDALTSRYDIRYISMADELFAPNPNDAKAFCQRMKPYNISWHADFSINNVRPDLLPIMKEGGLDVMFFGLESADNRILASMRKGITIEKMESVLKMVQEQGIPIFGSFIFGDVAETMETAENTLKWWRAHPEYLIHLTLLKPFPGTHIYKYACEQGIIKDRIQYLKDGCPQINISQMSPAEFAELGRKISDASETLKKLEFVELLELDATMGRVVIASVCPVCATKNTWNDVKLFAIDYLTCHHCTQKFHIPLPEALRSNLENQLIQLLERHGKIVIWGMTLAVMELFKRPGIFTDPRLFAVDISESKRGIDLYGRQVYDPAILDRENIPVVVVAVPSHIGQITCQVKENHPQVVTVLDICQLVSPCAAPST